MEENKTTYKFVNHSESSPLSELKSIDVIAIIDSTEIGNIEVKLTNNHSNSISLNNPIYFLTYQLYDRKGKLIPSINKPPIPLINNKETLDPKEDWNFEISGIKNHQDWLPEIEEVNKPVITLLPEKSYTYRLKLKEAINNQNKPYTLKMSLSLISPTSEEGSTSNVTLHTEIQL
ncbi:hypothetical protein GCM10011344_25170 [Dokdonia pacifica]|uniref:Uncharacterized protein n=2 Tax=Dokdonia pacifica TaxID=1627892 RepID=A0A238WRD6_9FLAO|nr:hypothetical protein [Dokdonia pacifica]GGG23391.1 hypothetical protein GCM10011344_25170 [Dokdonia pacifica]SNR48913.1 hypothetical protein SAMN06265376_1011372 [Dokdonia pacifica]